MKNRLRVLLGILGVVTGVALMVAIAGWQVTFAMVILPTGVFMLGVPWRNESSPAWERSSEPESPFVIRSQKLQPVRISASRPRR